jgi:hypothetical protein
MSSAPAGREVGREVISNVDPRTPLFFFSYAHSGDLRSTGPAHEPNRQVIKFFDDLSENVAELVSRTAGADPGFLDRSIPGGGKWTEELLHAVGTCQVFVALLSAPYLRSEWCGMEWYAFSQRKVVRSRESASDHQTSIIPVVWAPAPRETFPKAVRDVQRFSPTGLPDPDIAAQYKAEGVYGLLRMQLEVSYQAVVWRLAQRIADLHYSHRVEPRTFERGELRNIFREGGP